MKRPTIISMLVSLSIILLAAVPTIANLRIMSYNIKDFWLRFDGESGTVTGEGAELDKDDLERIEIVADIINQKRPDVIGILECASLAELLFFNERFLEGEYRCWSFRAYDSRTYGISLGLMVKKDLRVKSVDLIDLRSFSSRGIIVADVIKDEYEFTLVLVHLKSKVENKLRESVLKRDKQRDKLREIIEEKLQVNSDANIIICGDFNDFPGRDEQEEATGVENLVEKMMMSIVLSDGMEVRVYSPTSRNFENYLKNSLEKQRPEISPFKKQTPP